MIYNFILKFNRNFIFECQAGHVKELKNSENKINNEFLKTPV